MWNNDPHYHPYTTQITSLSKNLAPNQTLLSCSFHPDYKTPINHIMWLFERTFVSIRIFREKIVIKNCYWHYYLYFCFKGSFIYDIHKKEGGVSQNFGQFCKWFQMIIGESVFFWLFRSTPPNSNPIFSIMYYVF